MEEKIWAKITGNGKKIGRTGAIPVFDTYDDTWKIFYNVHVIWPSLENAADPEKVDRLRRQANSLLDRFPDTVPQLEKLGVRVKSLLAKPIKTPEDVQAWAESIFNTGPIGDAPRHVEDALALVYDDFNIYARGGRHPVWVLPAAPRGSGVVATIDFTVPASKVRYGPRHEFTKTALSQQLPSAASKRVRPSTGRPRGRPRKDGLTPGSKEAKAADAQKQRDLLKARAAREKEREQARKLKAARPVRPAKPSTNGHISEVAAPPARRVLARVGGEAA